MTQRWAPWVSLCLTDPRLGAREASDSEMLGGVTKEVPTKPAFSRQRPRKGAYLSFFFLMYDNTVLRDSLSV